MNNTLKISLFSILFLAIGFIGGFVVYNEHLLPAGDEAVDVQEEVVQDENKELQETNSEMTTYTSEKLGVFFQYPKTEGQTIKIIENGNKITMSGNGYGSFEVISKPENEAVEDSIARLEPDLRNNQYCFLAEKYVWPNIHKYSLTYPYAYLFQSIPVPSPLPNVIKKSREGKTGCYSSYYYIYDDSVTDKFVKANISYQSVEYSPSVWIESLGFIKN